MKVRFEPIEETIDVEAGETVLDAAFRQGLNLVYGCREGQCSACKCFLLEGEADLKRYSNFALSDTERANGYSLMCRAMPEQDLVIELLHYDPDNYKLEHAIRDGSATVEAVEELTHDITRLVLKAPGFDFTPGQYVDLHVPGESGVKRSFSMANLPGEDRIELMIKRYPGGKLSGMLEGQIKPGDTIAYTGPYGSLRARESDSPILMVAGGSGMAPILSLLREFARVGCERPIRFFYGARTEQDLFHLDEIRALPLKDFVFTPVTERFVHEAVDEYLQSREIAAPDIYMCGPPPMVEAAEEMLAGHGIDEQRIYVDKFTVSADALTSEISQSEISQAPIKRIGDAGSPQSDESEREFAWYQPAKRRATLYEDVTVDTQPSVHRHLTRGWPLSFEDGRGTWDDASTSLRATDWYAFRDPGEQWERTFYQSGNASEQQIEGAVRAAIQEGLIADYDPAWVDFLRRFLQVPAYVEHGLWFATATIGRDCLSDTVATCVCLQAAMKQRSAQSIVLYAMDLEEFHGDFSIDAARQTWLTMPEWQGTRRYLERLAATRDWGEVIVAANLCFEPTVGTLLRRELGTRAAAANGDTVTPTLARVETQEWEWTRAWTTALVRFLLEDRAHGEHNRALIAAWVREWLPPAIEAGLALAPLAEQVPRGIDVVQALDRIRRYAAGVLVEAGLDEAVPLLGVEVESSGAGLEVPAPSKKRRVRASTTKRPRVSQAPAPPTDGTYDFVGIVMAKSAEGDAVARVLGQRDDITVYEQPAFWDIRAEGRLVIPYDEVSEQLGYEIDAYSIQHEMSTHYGRMVATDEALMLFSDPTEAMQYLMA
jgi:NAD(P)H-flavin reductase/ferredoxin